MSRRPIAVGDPVKCTVPGRRSFLSTVLALRDTEEAVDVTDPRNGGRRTLRAEHVRHVPRRRQVRP